MRKSGAQIAFFLFAVILSVSIVSAAWSVSVSNNIEVKSNADQKLKEILDKSPLFAGISYFIFGVHDIDDPNDSFAQSYGLTSIFIMFFLIWLILFVTFSDIISVFGAFSHRAIGWIVGFAITVIAANMKLVQLIAIWGIKITSLFGAFAVFAGIILAFAAFLAISLGGGRFAAWALNRQANIHAAHGRTEMREGVRGMREAGRELQENQNQNRWWIWVVIGIIAIILVGIILYQLSAAA